MLRALKFVQGAVAKKDFVPEMTHFHIKAGEITSSNGVITLCSPIGLNLEVRPKADQMAKAIAACQGEQIVMHLTAAGKLSIKAGAFRATVECLPLTSAFAPPASCIGQGATLSGNLIPVLRKLFPLISEDASRPWSRGILLRNGSAFATNNIIAVEHWLSGWGLPFDVNLPRAAIVEMLRIGEEPLDVIAEDGAVSFTYEGGRWLRTQVLSLEWPDLSRVLEAGVLPLTVAPAFWDSLTTLSPLADKMLREVYVDSTYVATTLSPDTGASVECQWATDGALSPVTPALFNIDQLLKLKGVATAINMAAYPAPCTFNGDQLRGAIVGLRPAKVG